MTAAAHLARVRLDARVQAHVAGQHVGAGEGSPAHIAGIGFGNIVSGIAGLVARGHVLGQAVVQREHLAAGGANVGHIRTGRHLATVSH